MTHLRTSAVATRAGVSVETLRYYERRGLIEEPLRSLGGHRLYTEETVSVLRSIRAAQRLGFTLEEVSALISSGAHRHNDANLQEQARQKLLDVESRIQTLLEMAESLTATIAAECANLEDCAMPKSIASR